jgi:hypothetical protein
VAGKKDFRGWSEERSIATLELLQEIRDLQKQQLERLKTSMANQSYRWRISNRH